MQNKVALITGANAGLGLATAKELAARQFDLILLCRNHQKGQMAQAEIQRVNPSIKVDLITTWDRRLSGDSKIS